MFQAMNRTSNATSIVKKHDGPMMAQYLAILAHCLIV